MVRFVKIIQLLLKLPHLNLQLIDADILGLDRLLPFVRDGDLLLELTLEVADLLEQGVELGALVGGA